MYQYLTLQYHFKGKENELELLRYLCHTAKNVYNNAVYLIKREYLKNNRLPLYRYIEAELVNKDFKKLHITTSYELYTRAYQLFKLVIAKNQNGYNRFKEINPDNLPRFLPKFAYTTIVIKDVKFDLQNLKMRVPINKDELLNNLNDDKLKIFINKLKNDYITFNIPKFFNDKIKKPIHLKICPSKDGRVFTFFILYAIDKPRLKIDNGNALAMDLGVDNLASCVDTSYNAFIIDGRRLKSILHLYNKKIADLQGKLPLSQKGRPIGTSKRIERMYIHRRNKVNDYLDKAVAKIIKYALENNITTIVIGWNKGLTNGGVKLSIESSLKLKSRLNQSFMGIPFEKFREKIKTRCMLKGIKYVEKDESYTSVKSFYDNDNLNDRVSKASGKRITRGLYETKDGKIINADINAALNILRKYLESIGKALETPNKIIVPYRIFVYDND